MTCSMSYGTAHDSCIHRGRHHIVEVGMTYRTIEVGITSIHRGRYHIVESIQSTIRSANLKGQRGW